MTTCVYCKKCIDEYGDYKDYSCPRQERYIEKHGIEGWEDFCYKCRFFIPDGEEVPC